ncbi:MAG TPA: YihY/virulence factor BrkB family protein, partial [Dehalococcoidia bacterium]|nr:YihY/virulence factor BrkB family protein [Dehalococcoidia bacterium]
MFAISPALEAARSWFPLRLLVRAARRYSADDCALLAASISYYVLFSIFPLLIFVVGILGLFLVDSSLQQDVIDKVMDILPLSEDSGRNSVADTVHAVAGYQGSAIGILGLLVMAWSGSNMFGAVRKALNRVFAVSQKRPLWRQKLTDAAMALALVLFFVISLAITTVLRLAERYSDEIPYFGDLAQRLGFVWIVPALLLPLLLSFAAFTVLYWLVPTGHRNPREVWQGALLAAVAFEVTKSLFGIYLQNFSNYDVVFGSLGAVAAFLFAVYVSAGIMLFGAEVAAEYPRLRAEPAPVRVPRVIQPKRPSWRQR